jgi:hypothetical protein
MESGPFEGGNKPDLDESPELDPTRANFYQSQIGILRWYVELGRINIITEVSMLSTYLCLPLEGHLEAVFHVSVYLGLHHNTRVVFYPTYPAVDMGAFIKTVWKSIYGDVKEMIPSDAPIPHGKEVDLRLVVDSDHAGEQFTRCSRTGFVIYLNMAPIVWFSKRQPTVESSVFGAEFFAIRNGIETCRWPPLQAENDGCGLECPTFVYGENMSVVHNNQRPESVLKKKSDSICYHAVSESSAMGESIIGHVPSVENPADICTKVVPGGQKRKHLMKRFAGLGGFLVSWATQYKIRWVEFVCALFPANLLLSQNDNISLRGLRKSMHSRACALERAWRSSRY